MSKKAKGWSFDCGATRNIWGQKIDKRPRNIWGQVTDSRPKKEKATKPWYK